MIDPILLAMASLVAAAVLGAAFHSRRQYLLLPELTRQPPGAVADHCVIVPARNEAPIIARCVRSFPSSPVIVIDDQSTDATARNAAEAGAAVRPANPLPAGWLGKPNACWSGAQNTDSTWILFVDADTWYWPDFAPSLLSYAEQHNLDAVSVFPRQRCHEWYEHALLPYAFGLYFAGVNAHAVNDPRRAESLANGQCLLFRRKAYEFLGGHRAVARSVIEDVALAARLKRHRMAARVLRCESMAEVRMYDSFGALWRGFEKNSFRFLQVNPWTGIKVVLTSIAMMSALPVAAALALGNHWFAAAGIFAVPILAWRPWYGSWRRSLWAPVAVLLFQCIAISAMVKAVLGLTTDWKGRRV